MAHPLDLSGVWAKLDRTDQQSVFIDTEWRAFRDKGDAYSVEFERDSQPASYIAYLRVFKPIDPRLSVIFGEIIHNLRSALNHLVCRLVEGYGGTVGSHHAFPICLSPAEFRGEAFAQKNRLGRLEGIPPHGNVWTLIEDAQPYKCGKAARDHPFFLVNQVWNEDKHRTINQAHVLPEPADFIDAVRFGDTGAVCIDIDQHFVRGTPAKDRTKLVTFRFDPRSPEPDMKVKRPLPLHIAFGDGQGEPSDIGLAHALIYNLAQDCKRVFP